SPLVARRARGLRQEAARPEEIPGGRQLLVADATALAQRLRGRRRAADDASARADHAHWRARAGAGTVARAHGAIRGATATAVESGRLSLDLRRAGRWREARLQGLATRGRPWPVRRGLTSLYRMARASITRCRGLGNRYCSSPGRPATPGILREPLRCWPTNSPW